MGAWPRRGGGVAGRRRGPAPAAPGLCGGPGAAPGPGAGAGAGAGHGVSAAPPPRHERRGPAAAAGAQGAGAEAGRDLREAAALRLPHRPL